MTKTIDIIQKRGMLTPRIVKKAEQTLGIVDLNVTELRLMPYLMNVMMNEQKIDPNKINQTERDILSEWKKLGWIEGSASGLAITKDFWNAMTEIVFLGYVDLDTIDQVS